MVFFIHHSNLLRAMYLLHGSIIPVHGSLGPWPCHSQFSSCKLFGRARQAEDIQEEEAEEGPDRPLPRAAFEAESLGQTTQKSHTLYGQHINLDKKCKK